VVRPNSFCPSPDAGFLSRLRKRCLLSVGNWFPVKKVAICAHSSRYLRFFTTERVCTTERVWGGHRRRGWNPSSGPKTVPLGSGSTGFVCPKRRAEFKPSLGRDRQGAARRTRHRHEQLGLSEEEGRFLRCASPGESGTSRPPILTLFSLRAEPGAGRRRATAKTPPERGLSRCRRRDSDPRHANYDGGQAGVCALRQPLSGTGRSAQFGRESRVWVPDRVPRQGASGSGARLRGVQSALGRAPTSFVRADFRA
jgi:hypothetical protein